MAPLKLGKYETLNVRLFCAVLAASALILSGCGKAPDKNLANASPRHQPFKAPNGMPSIVIESIKAPKTAGAPLEIVFLLAAGGASPIAIAQKDFEVSISNEANPYLFAAKPLFPDDSPKFFIAQPGLSLLLRATALSDKADERKTWQSLPPGEYNLQIFAFGGKSLEFDYQWRGQTYSEARKLIIGK